MGRGDTKNWRRANRTIKRWVIIRQDDKVSFLRDRASRLGER